MEEKEIPIVWYKLRGLGLVCLCSLVFFAGAFVTDQKSITASSTAQELLTPVCSVEMDQKTAALTFDADLSSENTQTILNILEKYGVKATFFVTGKWVEAHPEEVKRIAAAGHDLGNHGQNHVDMSVLERSAIQQEIQQVHTAVQELTGIEMNLFRAPYGAYGEELLKTVELSGYLPIEWEIDTEDWKNYGVDAILRKVSQPPYPQNGSIIRMHNGADYITQALEPLIASMQDEGYELIPVSQMVHWSGYYLDAEGRQRPSP